MTEMLPVRPATTNDLPALKALVDRGYRGLDGTPGWTHEAHLFDGARIDLEALADMIAQPGQVVLVHEADAGPIACVLIADAGGGTAYLGLLCVDPPEQATGLGRRMIAVAEAEAMARFGATLMEMTVIDARTDLIAWYSRRGYAVTDELRPLPPGIGERNVPLALRVLVKPLV